MSTLIDGSTRRSKCDGVPHSGGLDAKTIWQLVREAMQGFVGLRDAKVRCVR